MVDQRPVRFGLKQPSIHNVVITTNTGGHLDLPFLARNLPNANYNPKRFAAVIIRQRVPYTTALLFTTGKIVCTGAPTVEMAHTALISFVNMLRKIHVAVQYTTFQVVNIVGASGFVQPDAVLRLNSLRNDHAVEYEPELFPGLSKRFRMIDGTSVMVIIFSSGKMILTGNRYVSHLTEVLIHVQRWIENSCYIEVHPERKRKRRTRLLKSQRRRTQGPVPSTDKSSEEVTRNEGV